MHKSRHRKETAKAENETAKKKKKNTHKTFPLSGAGRHMPDRKFQNHGMKAKRTLLAFRLIWKRFAA
jgi:hypothetical protein